MLKKTIGDIFSERISGKITNFPPNHNKRLIEKLRNEDDLIKKIYFNELFNLTFIQCLRHFMGIEYISELNGLIKFKDIKDNIIEAYKDGDKYENEIERYLYHFEEFVNNKKSRIRKKKTDEKDNI